MENKDPARQSGIQSKDNSAIHVEHDMVGGDIKIGRDQINLNANFVAVVVVSLLAAVILFLAALVLFGKLNALEFASRTPTPTAFPTPSCITEKDIIVTFHVFENKTEIASLASGETVALEPDAIIRLQPEVTSVTNATLPSLEFVWTNLGIATDGKLLHQTGNYIDYRSGHKADAVSMQLTQPSCEALALYHFFIAPNAASTPSP